MGLRLHKALGNANCIIMASLDFHLLQASPCLSKSHLHLFYFIKMPALCKEV